ncbi:MAG: quinone-interacting membrane-bound oxidoreductase complex subunit QmoC [Nitrospirae bacterium]|nr:quinone-interacting membrane-bound oxidoreductase complex subunit QmoC [Nitrospirota bacterium]
MSSAKMIQPDLDFVKEITAQGGGESLKKCFQCATCSVVCNLTHSDKPFPRKEMLWAQWGLKDRLMGDPDVWLCHQCSDCTAYCPRGAKPGEVLGAVRKMSIRANSWPGVLGGLVGSPAGLLPLFLLPVFIFGAIIMGLGRLDHLHGPIVYEKLMPIPAVDTVFILTALFACLSFFLGVTKFWKAMSDATGKTGAQGSVIPSIVETVKDIIAHKRFDKCDVAKGRASAHKFVFWGFAGLAVVTTVAIIYLYGFHWESPYDMKNPVKWLAFVSMLSLLYGIFSVIANRNANAEKAGKGGYFDWLFIYIIVGVALTGTLSWGIRLLDIAPLAYTIYFFHLVFIFCLFAYAPFSKMAHMVYRTTAMVFARHTGFDK